MTYKSYDPKQISITLRTTPITGFAEDSQLSIEMEDAQWNDSTDSRGNVTRVKSNKNIATIIFKLTQTSVSNDFLRMRVEADRVKSAGVFPVMIKCHNGTFLFSSNGAWIQDSNEYSDKVVEWIITATGIEWSDAHS